MLFATLLGFMLKPTQKLADESSKIDLETMIPKEFGRWKLDSSVLPLQVSPDIQANLDKLYSQVLSRTYVDKLGHRVMVSISYGEKQKKESQVHLPEVCYPAQGFQMSSRHKSFIEIPHFKLPVMRLIAQQGQRIEPITYWVRIGDTIALGALEQKVETLRYGMRGMIADGILVRVSSIGDGFEYQRQDEFVRSLLKHITAESRSNLIGIQH